MANMYLGRAAVLTVMFVVFLASLVEVEAQWRGNVCVRRSVRYERRRRCAYSWWGSCVRYKYYSVCVYYNEQHCCNGWRHNGNRNCNIPICNPRCYNGGTCTQPNKCRCRAGFNGDLCKNEVCSHRKPCYPGTCAENTDDCTCSGTFTGVSCLSLGPPDKPELNATTAVMYVVDPPDHQVFYSVQTDATFPDESGSEEFWTNLLFFNKLNVTFETFHRKREDLPSFPSYVTEAEFGIVEAEVNVEHIKQDNYGRITVFKDTVSCNTGLSRDRPKMELHLCRPDILRFVTSLEHNDLLKITVRSKNGGFRTVVDRDTRRETKAYYVGRQTEKTMLFRFDFRKPYHCTMSGTCNQPAVQVEGPDIRKNAFTMKWPGWRDDLSGIERYVWKVFRLQADRDKNLTEVDPPVYEQEASGTSAGSRRDTYQPALPGMYSVYLQVADWANNSQFSRTLALYDPTSDVEINSSPEARLFVASASPESDYNWQQNLTSPIVVSWKNHFGNRFHESNSLLNAVNPFPPEPFVREIRDRKIVDDKGVTDGYDDHQGERTVEAIRNVHGIVRFQAAYDTARPGASCTQPPNNWVNVTDPWGEEHEFNTVRRDGATVCVWVKAIDVLGNSKTDVAVVHFDSSAPEVGDPNLERNVGLPGVLNTSKVTVRAGDDQSGIKEIIWSLKDAADDSEFGSRRVSARLNQSVSCGSLDGSCDCPTRDSCYRKDVEFYIPHCLIKSRVPSLVAQLELVAVNEAGLQTPFKTLQLGDITKLNGINECCVPV